MLQAQDRVHEETLSPAERIYFYTPTATTAMQMGITQMEWRIANAFAFTLSLPPVAEAKGKTAVISVTSATAAVTLTDYGTASYNDSENWEGDYTLDAAEDRIVLYSTGREWTVIENQIA